MIFRKRIPVEFVPSSSGSSWDGDWIHISLCLLHWWVRWGGVWFSTTELPVKPNWGSVCWKYGLQDKRTCLFLSLCIWMWLSYLFPGYWLLLHFIHQCPNFPYAYSVMFSTRNSCNFLEFNNKIYLWKLFSPRAGTNVRASSKWLVSFLL